MALVSADATRHVDAEPPRAAAIAYSALFAAVLPAALVAWMVRLDRVVALPRVGTPLAAAVLLGTGGIVTAWGLISLWRHGRGLPMSPFPPPVLAVRGAYAFVADPIYVGAAILCLGTAVALGSPAGTWIVTPVFSLAMAAFVLGYERDATVKRFGALPRTAVRLPGDEDGQPSVSERVSVYLLVIVPWLIAYRAVAYLGVATGATSTYLPFEAQWPVIPWTEAIYFAAYPVVALVPLVANDRRNLRRFALDGLVATAFVIPFYLMVPFVSLPKAVPAGTPWGPLLAWERAGDSPVTALPSFYVIWACIAGTFFGRRWPRAKAVVAVAVLVVAASCVTTGMHSLLDLAAGFAAWGMLSARGRIWAALCTATESIANSWREWTFGPVRLMSHGFYAGVGAAGGVGIAVALAGREAAGWLIAMALVAEAGAATWAQVVEGSPQLLRPYGYFGSVVAVLAAAPIAWAAGFDPWLLLASFATGACFAQICGRMRCLVQGCCHGRPVAAPWGIRYGHPRSRVLRLSPYGGVRLHPTPLYAMVASAAVGAAMLRLWVIGAPLPFIGGTYLVLMGLTRFVEEHYRGEPQTAWVGGLRLYQWLAIAFVVVGASFTAIGGAPAPRPGPIASGVWPWLLLLAVVTTAAYGVDFPRSNRRFSRLV